ncbi:MAG: hypothetical protein IPP72_11005 [Chitinophagaceae bacterium]|nr:hypothetical protein [Chitinophagaceae bacterium]
MITATNIAFTLLIKIKGRQREFNFRKRSDANYDTDTNDELGNRYIFRMEKAEGTWKINGRALPEWLLENEALISEALEKNG